MPWVTQKPTGQQNGDIVTQFVNTTSTTSVTYEYPTQQSELFIKNNGTNDIFVSVGSISNRTLASNSILEVKEPFLNFSIHSNVNSQQFTATSIIKEAKDISGVNNQITEVNNQITNLATQLADIAINVNSFGAKGDGITDDTNAIQNAINECVTKKKDTVELKDNKEYIIRSPIVIKKGVTLRLGNNTKIKAIGNFRVFELENDAALVGGVIEITDSAFDKEVIYLDGKHVFYTYNKAEVKDVLIRNTSGSYKGKALSLFAGMKNWECVSFVNFTNIRIMGFEHGVYLNAPPPTSTMVWINANRFVNLSIEDCVNGIELNGKNTTPNECSGNFFLNFQIQLTDKSQTAIIVDGSYNIFEGFIWDTQKMTHTNPIINLTTEAHYNRIFTNAPSYMWVKDEGSYNYYSSPTEDNLFAKSLPPADPSKWYMVGDQDDILVNADKFATVTQLSGVAKVGSSFPQLFDLLRESWMGWDNSTEENPTVIELNFGTNPISYFKTIGMTFAGSECPKYLKFEFVTSNGGNYTITEEFKPNTKSVVQTYRTRIVNVYKIKITMYGSNNTSTNRIKATRIFASAGQTQGRAWVSTNGGKVYGDIEHARSTDGIIMTSPDGGRWKASMSNTGTLTWTKQ